jgi:hypothetical protein
MNTATCQPERPTDLAVPARLARFIEEVERSRLEELVSRAQRAVASSHS